MMFITKARVIVAVAVIGVVVGLTQGRSGGETLTVQVADAAGNPLRACITVISPEHQVTSFCQVDQNGRTTIPNLPARKYRVSAKSAGFVMQQKEIELGAGTNLVSFTLQPKR